MGGDQWCFNSVNCKIYAPSDSKICLKGQNYDEQFLFLRTVRETRLSWERVDSHKIILFSVGS